MATKTTTTSPVKKSSKHVTVLDKGRVLSSQWPGHILDRKTFNTFLRSQNVKPLPAYELVKEFTIDRRTWLRGRGMDSGLFRRKNTQMGVDFNGSFHKRNEKCCIGFYALACGFRSNDLVNKVDIAGLDGRVNPKRTFKAVRIERVAQSVMVLNDNDGDAFFGDLYIVNDKFGLDDATRERFITARFAEVGVKVKFKN